MEHETTAGENILATVYEIIAERKANPVEGAYTTYLFRQGVDKICKKVAEEGAEVVIAAKNQARDEIVDEVSDLIYHLSVLMVEFDISWSDIFAELKSRREA